MVLKGKKAIITGGTSGIGKEIALSFAKNGIDVAIFGTNEDRAKAALKEIMQFSENSLYKIVDVSKYKEVEDSINDVYEQFEKIDILVNNAGITKDNFLIKLSEEDWDRVLQVNLKSVYNTTKVCSRFMMKRKSGNIINITSIVGIIGNPCQTNYAASKAGMIGFSKSLAKELARKNIRVNCIAPGFIKTKMTENLPDKIKEAILNSISMKRFGEPNEVAQVALFLANNNMSGYINGQVICVDGGMVI